MKFLDDLPTFGKDSEKSGEILLASQGRLIFMIVLKKVIGIRKKPANYLKTDEKRKDIFCMFLFR